MRQVYMDHAATTPVATDVLNAMIPYFTESFGNPSSLYTVGQKNKEAITAAREKVAKVLNASPDEIYFTSGGTESDNWALKGTAFTYRSKGNHIITTKIEHHAILHSAEYLAKLGYDVTYLDVDSEGRVSVEDVEKAITDKTILVSIMFANNEIGTIQPIAEIGKLCHKKGILFHTDAVQAVAHVPIDVKAMNVDMLSLSAHKFYGPKGTGVMYIRKGVKLDNYIHGGGQERGRRATTENVAGIVGLGAAIERANLKMEEERRRLSELRNNLIAEIMNRIPYAKLNGTLGENRLPNNVNVSLIGVEGETLIMDLDMFGISASTGSACSSGSLDPSHVLMAIGLSHEQAHGSLRLSLGESTTKEDIDYVVEKLVGIVERRRNMSPLWEDFIKAQERSN